MEKVNFFFSFLLLHITTGSEAETEETTARMEKYMQDESNAILKEQADVLAGKKVKKKPSSYRTIENPRKFPLKPFSKLLNIHF